MANVIVGLGGLISDPAVCVLVDGQIAAAVEQEKLARQHRPGEFPDEAFAVALQVAGVKPEEISCVAVARPFAGASESDAQLELRARFAQADIFVADHHQAHAASAFYPSPFESASVLSVDRAGDYRSAVLYRGENGHLTRVRELYFPDSFGDLFNRVTDLLGYEPRADEHKVQWLSTSGEPRFRIVFDRIIGNGEHGWPRFDRSYFDADFLRFGGFSRRFYEECGFAVREPIPHEARADLAASVQEATGAAIARLLGDAEAVCLAGGLSLNSILVHTLERTFPKLFVQPVGGNAGTALGAALAAWHGRYNGDRKRLETLCLGPEYSAAEVKQVLENCKLRFQFVPSEEELISRAVEALQEQKIVAWMQGRMEFGPRALGNRSILASPLNPYSTENLNVFIKHREKTRKFAASIPAELAAEYFECGPNAEFLATVSTVKPQYRETFQPAILGENLVRVHTVRKETNPLFHRLLLAAGQRSGLPILYNTSFNLFGDPLVATPRDALRSFYSSGIDALFAGSFYLDK